MRVRSTLAAVAALAVAVPQAGAQDVELLSRIYGTPLPTGYATWRAQHPGAFQFTRGRSARIRVDLGGAGGGSGAQGGRALDTRVGPLSALGPRGGAVAGTFRIPVVMGLFNDSPAGVPVTSSDFADAFFGNGPLTVKAYYYEVSGGRVTLDGDVQDWVRSSLTQTEVAGGTSGLSSPARVGDFIVSLLDQEPEIDWGLYDNDGPDGIPNSGDDDGFVDAIAVIQPLAGAECGGNNKANRIWSHKWSLSNATTAHSAYTTATPAAGGGFIQVDDYFIQSAVSCSGTGINEIGVFTHETGHAFGLPDLYDTRNTGTHSGDGNWDLMATGAWGCDGKSPGLPCHMGAWSKSVLGWADVIPLASDADLGSVTVAPVEEGGAIFRLESGDGSGTYYLLENRQRVGFDHNLFGPGLLVWQIDPVLLAQRWPANGVNGDTRLAVWIRQADGQGDLQSPGGGRGDSGDPFPYTVSTPENHVFHASSVPASRSFQGTATGVTLLDIQRVGSDIALHALTRFSTVTIRSEGDSGNGGLFAVDGVAVTGASDIFSSAPFDDHEVEAAAGESLGPGRRTPFQAWADDPGALRIRTLVTPIEDVTLTALYGGSQVQLAVTTTGGINGVEPATFETVPASGDLWFADSTDVTILAVPRQGFSFLRWTGALDGQPNPTSVVMNDPVTAGADFLLTYAVPPTNLDVTAAQPQDVQLAPENGTAPFYWYIRGGRLADGLHLDPSGHLIGAALELGDFSVQVEVKDAIGLSADGEVSVHVAEPRFTLDQIGASFLLTGAGLTDAEENFLDAQGNGSGAYDLGDFRAWVLAHPGLPAAATVVPRAPAPSAAGGGAGR